MWRWMKSDMVWTDVEDEARSTIPFSSLEYAVAKDYSIPHSRKSSWRRSLWKAGPWSVWITSGDPKRPIWLSITDAVSKAVVDLVGNSSTHREKASMITSMYSLPCASLVNVKYFKWIVGGTGEAMSLDLDLLDMLDIVGWILRSYGP